MTPYDRIVQRVEKPWGYELHFALTDCYCGKVLFVREGESLSLQYHEVKDETLYLQSGRAEVTLGASPETVEVVEAAPGAAFHVAPGTVHRITAIDDSTFLEVSTPELEDVVRLEDRYGRAPRTPTDQPA